MKYRLEWNERWEQFDIKQDGRDDEVFYIENKEQGEKAVAELQTLQAENARLRQTLEVIIRDYPQVNSMLYSSGYQELIDKAQGYDPAPEQERYVVTQHPLMTDSFAVYDTVSEDFTTNHLRFPTLYQKQISAQARADELNGDITD